jgi:hypothetical protein
MSLEATFIKAGNLQRLCELSTPEGSRFVVEPYMIFTSGKKRRSYRYYERSSNVPDSEPGWRSTEARYISGIKLLDESFELRKDYDPFDKAEFPVVHHSIPTHDGRQRWMDARHVDTSTF